MSSDVRIYIQQGQVCRRWLSVYPLLLPMFCLALDVGPSVVHARVLAGDSERDLVPLWVMTCTSGLVGGMFLLSCLVWMGYYGSRHLYHTYTMPFTEERARQRVTKTERDEEDLFSGNVPGGIRCSRGYGDGTHVNVWDHHERRRQLAIESRNGDTNTAHHSDKKSNHRIRSRVLKAAIDNRTTKMVVTPYTKISKFGNGPKAGTQAYFLRWQMVDEPHEAHRLLVDGRAAGLV